MEDLNKNQIVLLTLLVSFVTSIATGIMTASLLQEAPLEVTRNINRIVEKTIETVTTPVTTQTTTQKEVTTVIVKEEDQIIDSINKNVSSIVRIKEKNPFTDQTSFYGIGIIINKDGLIATDRKIVSNSFVYTATLHDGTTVTIKPLGGDKQTNFILFQAELPSRLTEKEKQAYVFPGATLSKNDLKLGQSVISLGGEASNGVSVGRVVSLDIKESTVASTTTKYISDIETDVSSRDLVTGSTLFNLSGDIVGIKLSNDPLRTFTPIAVLVKEMSSLIEPPTESSKSQ